MHRGASCARLVENYHDARKPRSAQGVMSLKVIAVLMPFGTFPFGYLERAVQQERYSFHLIEQPMLGCCCRGAVPVWATCSIASNNSRRAFGAGLEGVAASIRPRYCRRRLASKPKKSGVHTAP